MYGTVERNPVERQPRLGTIPFHELVVFVAVPALSIHRTQAVQDSASGVLEIRESLDGLSRLPAAFDRFTLHGGGLVAITHDLSDSLGPDRP